MSLPLDDRPRLTLTHLALATALLALVVSLLLHLRSVEIFRQESLRVETLRGCRESAEAYFEARLRIQRLAGAISAPMSENLTGLAFDARRATARFSALTSHLGPLHATNARERYSQIANTLETLTDTTGKVAGVKTPSLLADVDRLFQDVNEDCVRSAR